MIETSLRQGEPVSLPDRSFGRQARSVIGYGLVTALMFVSPLLVFLPAALFHCAIRNGRRAAWASLVLAVALSALWIAISGQAPGTTPQELSMAWSALAAVVLSIALPSLAAVPMVERGEKFGRVILLLVVGAAIGLAVTEIGARSLTSFSPFAHVAQAGQEHAATATQIYREAKMPADAVKLLQRWADYSTFVLPGLLLIYIATFFVLSLLMLGRLKAWREFALRGREDGPVTVYLFRNFSLPDWLLFAFIIGGITPLVHGMLQRVAANVLAVVVFLYLLQGLAIFRSLLVAMGAGLIGSLLAWFLLVFLTAGIGPLLLGIAGLFDSFFDFRHFKKRKDDSNEGHSD